MTHRNLMRMGALSLFAVAALCAQNKAACKMPRTPDGHPDLQGIWSNATRTPLERPAEFAGKADANGCRGEGLGRERTRKRGRNWTEHRKALCIRRRGRKAPALTTSSFMTWARGWLRVDGVKRTSMVVDPPDGKIPPDARRKLAIAPQESRQSTVTM